MNKLVITIVSILTLISCNGKDAKMNDAPKKIPIIPVNAVVVEFSELDNKINTTGTILPNEEVDIKPEISGRVVKLNFSEGSRISKGQLLIKLNDRDLKAQLAKITVQENLAKQDESRRKKLLDKKAISQEEYDQSSSALEAILSDKELIKAQIEKTEIYAPFSGIIGLKYISEGANITNATNIVNLLQLDPVKIEFSVPERYASTIRSGTEISFSTNDNKQYKAIVYAVEGKVDQASRTYKVRARCSNSKKELVPGSFVKIEIILEKIKGAIVLPSASIVNELTGNKVYVADNGVARSVDVQTGIRTDREVQIISGINVGDTVMTTGLMQIKDNSKIIVKSIEKKQ